MLTLIWIPTARGPGLVAMRPPRRILVVGYDAAELLDIAGARERRLLCYDPQTGSLA